MQNIKSLQEKGFQWKGVGFGLYFNLSKSCLLDLMLSCDCAHFYKEILLNKPCKEIIWMNNQDGFSNKVCQ